jgi:hypothetical protein
MAELSVLNPSLADILSRTDPDGNISSIIEARPRPTASSRMLSTPSATTARATST